MNNQNNFYDPSFMLGTLLNAVGLDTFTLTQIIDRRIIISKRPEDIKTFILGNASFPETFLKKLTNLKIPLNYLNEIWKTNFNLQENFDIPADKFDPYDLRFACLQNLHLYIDHPFLAINTYSFSVKQGIDLRREIIKTIDKKNNKLISSSKFATLFMVSRSTIENDRKNNKQNK